MNSNTLATMRHLFLKKLIFVFILFSLGANACSPAVTEQPVISLAIPTIVPSRPCELKPGEKISLGVTGVSGTDVTYTWSASAGLVTPPGGPAVSYIAPNTGGDVTIRVLAAKGNQTSDGSITCNVIAPTEPPSITPPAATLAPTPTATELPTDTPPAATLTPASTPTATPTTWVCTSYRSQKPIVKGNIPGQVKIDLPAQGTLNIPASQSVKTAGSYTGIPAGKYLWVFIYSPEGDRYYPQTKGPADGWQPDPTTGSDGRWTINIGFGAPKLCYEVIVMAAEPAASKSIADQLQQWAANNNYVGYVLNGPSSADAPVLPDGLVEKANVEVKTK